MSSRSLLPTGEAVCAAGVRLGAIQRGLAAASAGAAFVLAAAAIADPSAPDAAGEAPGSPQILSAPGGEAARPQPDVEVQALSAENPFSTPLIEDAGLPLTLWAGGDAQRITALAAALQGGAASPAAARLAGRVLGAGGDAPAASDAATLRLGGARALALTRLGRAAEAERLLILAGRGALQADPGFAAAAAISDYLAGEDRRACLRGADLAEGGDTPIWLRIRALCYALAGEDSAARLTLDLLRDQNGLRPWDETFAAFIDGADVAMAPARTALDLAALRAAGVAPATAQLREASAGVLRAAALDESLDLAVRLHAGERALGLGALSPERYVTLVEAANVSASVAAAAADALTKASTALDRARAYVWISGQTSPAAQAEGVAASLASAEEAVIWASQSRLYAPILAALTPDPALSGHAGVFASALLAAGAPDAASRWLAVSAPAAPADLTADRPDPAPAPSEAAFAAVLASVLAPGAALGPAPEGMGRADRFILGAAGAAPLPLDAAEDFTEMEPALLSPALRAVTLSAAYGGRSGETALAVALALETTDLGVTPVSSLIDAIAALRVVGLEAEARRIAAEALWARRQAALATARNGAAE